MITITADLVKQHIGKRKADAHKGDFGRILIAAGKEGMMGAAVICARAAFRCGAGLVSVACSRNLFAVVHAGVPEATCVDRDALMAMSREELAEALSIYDAVAAGPGIGVSEEAGEFVKKLMDCYGGQLVLDADALNCIAKFGLKSENSSADIVITPHAGEAARLLGVSVQEINDQRCESVKKLADVLGKPCTAVLKGAGTLVCTENEIYMNTTGNPGMATGGSGDALTGAFAALVGRLHSGKAAAVCGVYLHGLAGDIAAAKLGEDGLMATDIADSLAFAMASLQEQRIGSDRTEI